MASIGHNSGRIDEAGNGWRTHAWAKARRDLMPTLPIEIVRRRVARARELGLPYKTYAGLRAASGDDLIGFMFSSNALGVVRPWDKVVPAKADKIAALKDVTTVGLVQTPIAPAQVIPPLNDAFAAPKPLAPWVQTRDALRDVCAKILRPANRMVMIWETGLEREWAAAGRMAGAVPAHLYFEATQ